MHVSAKPSGYILCILISLYIRISEKACPVYREYTEIDFYNTVRPLGYPRRIPKTRFAAHTASKVGLCPTSACSNENTIPIVVSKLSLLKY
jgi:hypothetical protein